MNQTRKKVKRSHTLDRRRGYTTPTDADVRCPFFDDTFFKMGDASIVNDMVPVCRDPKNTVACDYKDMLIDGQLCLCNRYWKEDINSFVPATGDVLKEKEQHLEVRYDYIREFIGKSAVLEANVFLKGDKAAWLKDVTWDDFPAQGATDWKKVGTNAIKTTANTSSSRLLYNGPNAKLLDDYEFTVKGYVDKDQWDGDYVGIVFRQDAWGEYLLQWDGGDNINRLEIIFLDYNPREPQKTLATHYGLKWEHGVHYEYSIRLEGEKIFYKITDITNDVVIIDRSTWHAPINGKPKQGTFGVYASSQEDAYFYDIVGSGGKIVTPAVDAELTQRVTLKWDGTNLTQPIQEFFTDPINRIKHKPEYAEYTIDHIEFKIVSHNVLEKVYFADTKTDTTTDGNQKVTIEQYDYDMDQYRTFKMTVGEDERIMQTHDENFPKDATIKKITVGADAQRFRDSFYVAINANPAYVVHSITKPLYTDNAEHLVPVGGVVRFAYQPSYMPLEFFTGPSIDTHNKKWGIRNNELGWHKVEVYGNE